MYIVFVPFIYTGDGSGDKVRGVKAGGPCGIRDPFVYKKAYSYVWFFQIDEAEMLAVRCVILTVLFFQGF